MIFNFVIIPINKSYVNIAYHIQNTLEEIHYLSNIIIDTNYTNIFASRVDNARQQKYNIITINDDYEEVETITVIFQHTGYIVETKTLQELFNTASDYENKNNKQKNIRGQCIHM